MISIIKYFKYVALVVFLFVSITESKAQAANGMITINIANVNSENGTIRVNVYRKEDDIFGKPYLLKLLSPDIRGLTVVFKNLPFADYTVYVFQDENNNEEMDHSFGLPAEPFGYSNDWKLSLFSGMPSFKKTKITFSEESSSVNIKLN